MAATQNINCTINGSLKLESPLKVATLNVRGLRNSSKQLGIVQKLNRERLDILAIQETHLCSEQEINTLALQWGGIVHFSPGTNRSKGVATLFSSKYSQENIKFIKSYDRIVFSSIRIDCENIMIVNIYSPCDNKRDKLSFMQELHKKIIHHSELEGIDNLICLGDFNITSSDCDILLGHAHDIDVRQSFNNFIDNLGLVDTWRIVHPEEKTFTWRNTRTARRLDYLFTSESMSHFISNSFIKGVGFTDHRLVITQFEFSKFNHGKGYYKLNKSLLKDTDYCNNIIKSINETKDECKDLNPHLLVEMIKCNACEVSQQYSKYKQRMKRQSNEDLTRRLNLLENEFISNPNDLGIQENISQVKAQLEILEMERAKGAQIRARCQDINEGEKCSKYFLSLEKNRSDNNLIKRLQTSSGTYVHGETAIVEEIASQFEMKYNNVNLSKAEMSNLFDDYIADVKLPSLDDNEKQRCDRQVTEEELKSAVKEMKKDSAPGKDGLPLEFYQMFWRQLKGPLLKSYLYSHEKGHLSYSERVGIITLLHKGKELPTYMLSNWRPISLTNVDYKILAKVLSMRTDTVISKLIGNQQTGFLKGRNISLMHRQIDDILSLYRKSNTPGILLAIDFKQAFDTLNVNCILKSLKAFGFGPNFIRWISVLNTDRMACVKNGGHISRYIDMTNGVRQGCPISPQLFVLAVEILAQKIVQDINIKGLSTYNGGESVKISSYADDKTVQTRNAKDLKRTHTHLKNCSFFSDFYVKMDDILKPIKISQYADDTSLFLRDVEDMKRAIKHINEFSRFSDLYLNINKTFALSTNGANIDTGDLGIAFKDTIKILGVYFSNKMPASEIEKNWLERIKNVVRIFGHWAKRKISVIGKVHIIKTFALSQFVFIMKSLSLPENVLENINRLCFNFLWSDSPLSIRACEKVKRTVMYNRLSAGGLKMINMITLQESILLEWVEMLASAKFSPWKLTPLFLYSPLGGCNVLRSKSTYAHFRGLDKVGSKFWRDVLAIWLKHSENHLRKDNCMADPINNNASIKHNGRTLFLESAMEKSCLIIRNILENDNRLRTLTEYRLQFGKYPRYFLDFFTMKNAIKNGIDIRRIMEDNNIYFKGVKIGKLGRKKFYSLISKEDTPLCQEVWKRKFDITINTTHWDLIHKQKETRLKSLAWKILHNIYPSNLLLYKMKIKPSPICSFCDDMDSMEHFFFLCEKVKILWDEVTKEINLYMGLRITLTGKSIILGVNEIMGISKRNLYQINNVINVAKLAISKYKYGPKRPILDIYFMDSILRNLWENYK